MKLLGQGVDAAVAAQTDIFGRDAFAAGLLSLFSNSQDPLVVALDEKWGTGKTVFARRLAKRAEEDGHIVVYFDAFKRDYDPDVFIALTADLLAKVPKAKQEKSFKQNAKSVGKIFGRVLVKGAVRAITAGAVKASDLDEAVTETASEIGDVAEAELDKIIDERLSSAKKEEEAFSKFRESLIALAGGTAGSDEKRKPIIFIIDELDRCRPDYALDVLETIKHFFSVAGVHFLLVCDFGLLVASVKARYGIDSDGDTYLDKFIDARITFPVQPLDARRAAISSFVFKIIDVTKSDQTNIETCNRMGNFLTEISITQCHSLRRIERIMTQFFIVMNFGVSNIKIIWPLVFLLCDMKISNKRLFDKSKIGELKFNELKEIYKFDENNTATYPMVIRYFFDEFIDRDSEEYSDIHIHLASRWQKNPIAMVTDFANNVVDRISI